MLPLAVVSVLSSLLTYSLVLLVGLYCWFQWSHRALLRAARNLPEVWKPIPFVGHSYLSFWGKEELTKSVLEMSRRAVTTGKKTVAFWCGPLPIIAVHDMDDIQTILTSSNTLDKGEEYNYFTFGLDSGVGEFKYNILSAPGQTWKMSRRYLNPLFHPRNLQHLTPLMNANSRLLVETLSAHVRNNAQTPINVMPHTMDIALKTVCDLLFGPGVTIDIKSEGFRGLMKVVETIPDLFINRVLRPWLRIGPLFRFIYRKEVMVLDKLWKTFTETPLKVSTEYYENKSKNATTQNGTNEMSFTDVDEPLTMLDVYSVLRKNYPEFTEADMRCDMLALYCTGTDTVGSGVASCLLALGQYQDLQERLYKEVISVVGKTDDVTLDDLTKMPYLDQVLKETLRCFLLVPYTLRKTSKDIKLNTCTIPAGNTIIVSLAGVHLDPKYYPDPQKFDPERFASERSLDDRYSFIPFSGGPRNCIAKTYAMQLMKVMLVHVIRRFRLRTEMDMHKLRRRLIVTLISADGYNISLEPRE